MPNRFGTEIQAQRAVVVDVLAGVEHVEAADPQRDRGAKDQHAQIESAGDGDPRGGRRNAEREAEKKVRPVREALGEGIEKQNRERQRSELQCRRIQLPRRDDENAQQRSA